MAISVAEYSKLAVECGLVTRPALDKSLAEVSQRLGREPADSDEFGQALMHDGLITDWQHDKISAGKSLRFFLGNYKLLKHLESGGMSKVYLAEHVRMRRKVAIKVLPTTRVREASYLERFLREGRSIAALNHPNLVQVFDSDNDGNVYYMVLEFIDGIDLQNLVDSHGPLTPEKAAEYTRQAALGLAHAHAKGMIHRDIKPGNLMLDKSGVVKILDMGLALLNDPHEQPLTLQHNEHVLGTTDYLAPEQALDSHDVDPRADLYSLGCTLYFFLTGQPPFPEGNMTERLMKHQTSQPTPVSKFRQDVPDSLLAVLHKLMAKQAKDRYRSAEATAQALAALKLQPVTA